ncbi:hypothetical protein M917_0151 [Psychrobacter aquaticus CMS 56]|uniref:Uncharacterized protein n=1 Tax=Psychrobacter aquaticus CMS 56 TaxID=1354303 RepID=U4TDY8_9GAMM|nr:hypothetical protein M917_0151 [Psychrobacter aquaticus CMS 56]
MIHITYAYSDDFYRRSMGSIFANAVVIFKQINPILPTSLSKLAQFLNDL